MLRKLRWDKPETFQQKNGPTRWWVKGRNTIKECSWSEVDTACCKRACTFTQVCGDCDGHLRTLSHSNRQTFYFFSLPASLNTFSKPDLLLRVHGMFDDIQTLSGSLISCPLVRRDSNIVPICAELTELDWKWDIFADLRWWKWEWTSLIKEQGVRQYLHKISCTSYDGTTTPKEHSQWGILD